MVPNVPLPPIPIPGVSKSILPGAIKSEKTIELMIFSDFYKNKIYFVRYCLMSQEVLTKTIVAVFRRVPKRGNPTMTTSTIGARRKGDPQHYVEEQNPNGLLQKHPKIINIRPLCARGSDFV